MSTNIHILKAVRVAFGYSQADVAAMINVSRRSVIRMENGEDNGLSTFKAVQAEFERQGVRFIKADEDGGWGVRMPMGWSGPTPEIRNASSLQGRKDD
ncbi:helix-turn-helix transcriptional regulator [Devosia sp. LjRoot3]|uniref:helix-turn-helix transcriptional regulator n=1 Tax=Devosia sp. LjRoot3 TaxID=3342319 RepID=UPI003ECC6F67